MLQLLVLPFESQIPPSPLEHPRMCRAGTEGCSPVKPQGFLTLRMCFKTDQGHIFLLFSLKCCFLLPKHTSEYSTVWLLGEGSARGAWDVQIPPTSWLGEERVQEKNPFFCSSEEVIPGE